MVRITWLATPPQGVMIIFGVDKLWKTKLGLPWAEYTHTYTHIHTDKHSYTDIHIDTYIMYTHISVW